jgi:hypothetical protein
LVQGTKEFLKDVMVYMNFSKGRPSPPISPPLIKMGQKYVQKN